MEKQRYLARINIMADTGILRIGEEKIRILEEEIHAENLLDAVHKAYKIIQQKSADTDFVCYWLKEVIDV